MTETRVIIIAALVGIVVLSVVLGLVSGRLAKTAVFGKVTLASLWLLSLIALMFNWHDANGWWECWPNCSLAQDLVGMTLIFALPMVAGISVVLAVFRAFRVRPE